MEIACRCPDLHVVVDTAHGVRTVMDAAGVMKVGGSDVDWVVGHKGLFFVAAAGFCANRERFYDPQTMRFREARAAVTPA